MAYFYAGWQKQGVTFLSKRTLHFTHTQNAVSFLDTLIFCHSTAPFE
jgi:hypothetical protein